jgi:hypothetical protein
MMPQFPALVVDCLLAAVFCGLAIIALARVIARQIVIGFEPQLAAHGAASPALPESDFVLSTVAKAAILVICWLAGLPGRLYRPHTARSSAGWLLPVRAHFAHCHQSEALASLTWMALPQMP